jgi:hypothetical protein
VADTIDESKTECKVEPRGRESIRRDHQIKALSINSEATSGCLEKDETGQPIRRSHCHRFEKQDLRILTPNLLV